MCHFFNKAKYNTKKILECRKHVHILLKLQHVQKLEEPLYGKDLNHAAVSISREIDTYNTKLTLTFLLMLTCLGKNPVWFYGMRR